MNYQLFKQNIQQKKIAPVYLFFGEDSYLRNQAINLIYNFLIDPQFKNFNFHIFDGKENTAEEIINNAKSYPFISNKKLIIVKNFQKINKKTDIENLLDYIKNPTDFTCLIFIEEERDKTNVFYKNILSLKTIVEFYSPFPQQLPFWVSNLIQSKGKQISPIASNLLIERVGNNLQNLVNEIEKLILYIGENKKIELKDIENVTSDIKINTIFELCSAIANKQMKKAILILEKLSKIEEPLKILFFLTQQLRKIWQAQNYLKDGIEEKKIASSLHIHPMFMKEIINATTKFNSKKWQYLFEKLLEADKKIKKGIQPGFLVLELAIIKVCVD